MSANPIGEESMLVIMGCSFLSAKVVYTRSGELKWWVVQLEK